MMTAAMMPASPPFPKVHTIPSIEPITSPVRKATFGPKITCNIIDKLISLMPTSY